MAPPPMYAAVVKNTTQSQSTEESIHCGFSSFGCLPNYYQAYRKNNAQKEMCNCINEKIILKNSSQRLSNLNSAIFIPFIENRLRLTGLRDHI